MRLSFEDYHQQNPNVWLHFEKFTIQTIQRGFQHYSAKGIFELIRWHTGVTTKGTDGFKINNNFTPNYARLFELRYPHHEGFFLKRELKTNRVSL